jgi:hypothetical protein
LPCSTAACVLLLLLLPPLLPPLLPLVLMLLFDAAVRRFVAPRACEGSQGAGVAGACGLPVGDRG